MANSLYDAARTGFLQADFNWPTGNGQTFGVVLVDSANYTVNLATHTSLADVSVSARIAGPVTLANCTIQTNGAADADDVTFTAVSGDSIEALVLYQIGVDDANSPLIAYIDTATGLPITPNGGDIIVTWDNGTNRIFRL